MVKLMEHRAESCRTETFFDFHSVDASLLAPTNTYQRIHPTLADEHFPLLKFGRYPVPGNQRENFIKQLVFRESVHLPALST